jgi:hypothetical protein
MYLLEEQRQKALQMKLYQNRESLASNLHVHFRICASTEVHTRQGLTVAGALKGEYLANTSWQDN